MTRLLLSLAIMAIIGMATDVKRLESKIVDVRVELN